MPGIVTGADVSQHVQPLVQDEIVELFAGTSAILKSLFLPQNKKIVDSKFRFYREITEDASLGFRKLNAPFLDGTSKDVPVDYSLNLAGGGVTIDKKAIQASKGSIISQKVRAKLKNLGRMLDRAIIHGSAGKDPDGLDGIYEIVSNANNYYTTAGKEYLIDSTASVADQAVAMGIGVGLAPAGLQMTSSPTNKALLVRGLRNLIARCQVTPDLMVMNSAVRTFLTEAMEENNITAGSIEQFGVSAVTFDNIPIYTMPKLIKGGEVIAFDENSPDGTSTTDCSSIVMCKFGFGEYFGALMGSDDIQVSELMKLDDGVTYRLLVELDINIFDAVFDSLARLGGIRQ